MRVARFLLFIVLAAVNVAAVVPAAAAPLAQDQQIASITAPKDGDQLKGVVQIMGTATHGKFDHYELAWAAQSSPENWQIIASVQNQITNGSLGTWDTTPLQPGVYRLRLRVVRQEDKFTDFIVNNLSINQGTPTPAASPTPPIGPTIAPSPTPGAALATPTVSIAQPPTSTPQATSTKSAAGEVATSTGSRTPTIQVNFASLGQAFCNGALYTFLIFVVWGCVLAFRGILRWSLKQARRQMARQQH
jgi:hypothetical protein